MRLPILCGRAGMHGVRGGAVGRGAHYEAPDAVWAGARDEMRACCVSMRVHTVEEGGAEGG